MTGRMSVFILTATTLAGSARSPERAGVIDAYARGDYSVIEAIALDKDGIQALLREIKTSAVSPRLKAAFLLEAFETVQRRQQLDGWVTTTETSGALVLRDAFTTVSALPAADPLVPSWFAAGAAALAHGFAGQSQMEWHWRLVAPNGLSSTKIPFEKYVDAGELALSRALPLEFYAWRSLYQDRKLSITREHDDQRAASNPDDALSRWVEREYIPNTLLAREAKAVADALAALRVAEGSDASRAEALMRQAALIAAGRSPSDAVLLFDRSLAVANDDWVKYLAHLLKGRALEALNRFGEAQFSYRAAFAIRPKARSANLALAALAYGQGTRADEHLRAVFDANADGVDPWAQFSYGAYRFWPERRDTMRRALR